LKQGLVLFAHGSRDPEWARPFDRIRAAVTKARPDCEVRLAYLDHMTPTLPETLASLDSAKVKSVQVVPLFFGLGGHLKEDLPRLVAEAPRRMRVSIAPPIGEQDAVIEAIAAAIAKSVVPGARASR
jgi:sirohydrochlorin cobaltochelatase